MRGRRQLGLTMVETIAIVGLISLIVLFTLGLIPSFKVANRRANMELQAGNIAQSTLEEQRARSFSSLASEPFRDVVVEDITYRLEVVVSPGLSDNSKRVRTHVVWSWKDRNYETFRETLVTRVPR